MHNMQLTHVDALSSGAIRNTRFWALLALFDTNIFWGNMKKEGTKEYKTL